MTKKNQSRIPPGPPPSTPSIDCTKRPPKRVSTSNFDCSTRITVSSSRSVLVAVEPISLVAEVARDADDRAALLLVARADAAAAEQQRGGDQRGDPPHGTSARSANERTSPALVA